ncbi:UNVERIFIED_CONTAM: hypothetical protein GTU68_021120 [Idotea baltica]|nr:hypothetical protein [Idotea baltica]
MRRALLSVSDKTGLIDLAKALNEKGVELLSTGGTAAAIRDAGLPVKDVSEITRFPEMMDGRVKTLHPMVHGGLLALRDNKDHVAAMDEHGIGAIDLLVVNLYPFEETVAKGGDYEDCIENIDIGGPAMIRAASKNHGFVTTVVDVQDYKRLLEQLDANDGATSLAFRQELAQIAYARTAAYDAAVSTWMAGAIEEMRYGENPHQTASFYTDGSTRAGVSTATQHQGKELSYNNINDTDAAFELVAEFDPADGPAVAIIKHANPCGVSRGATLAEAYENAYNCDRTSAFGGIVALNTTLDAETATKIVEIFTEVVIAPEVTDEAKAIFAAKKNLRLLTTGGLPDVTSGGQTWRQVSGGYLIQDRDNGAINLDDLKVVTKRAPSDQEMQDMLFAWKVAKHVKSNAIIYVKDGATVGVGAGQMSRVDSTRIAARKSEDMAEAMGLASDAFFPFSDGLLTAAAAGATAIIQPGGSMRDDEVIKAADDAGLAMVFTGMRHFRH